MNMTTSGRMETIRRAGYGYPHFATVRCPACGWDSGEFDTSMQATRYQRALNHECHDRHDMREAR